MPPGMSRVFAEQGVPAKRLDAAFVNGYMYTRLVPLIGGDKPPKKLPPAWVLRLVTRVHPEFRKRTRTATKTLAERPWNDIAVRWDREMRPLSANATRLPGRSAGRNSTTPNSPTTCAA